MIRKWINKIRNYAGRAEAPEQDRSDLYTMPEYAHSDRLEEHLQDLYVDLGTLSESFQAVVDEAKQREQNRILGKARCQEVSTAA
jgi:hypothetical protein